MIQHLKHTVLLLFSATLFFGCAPETPNPDQITLKLNWQHGSQFIGFYAAVSQGYYAEENLEITLEPLTDPALHSETISKVKSAEYDFALGAVDVLNAQNEGAPLVVFANIYKLSPGAFFAKTESGIVTPADLAGHTIAVKGEAWRFLLIDLLTQVGLTLDDVVEVPSSFDMTPFYEGEVDVWAGFLTDEVIQARLNGFDLVTFPLYEYGVSSIAGTIYTRSTLLETDPDLAVRFLRASLRGWDWAFNNSSEAASNMMALYPELNEEFDFYVASIEATIPLTIPSGKQFGEIDCVAWENNEILADLKTTEGLCTTKIFEAASSQDQ